VNTKLSRPGSSPTPGPSAGRRKGEGIPVTFEGKSGCWKTPAPLSLYFDNLLDLKVREFNLRYFDIEEALLGRFRHLHTNICGNREFVEHLRYHLCWAQQTICHPTFEWTLMKSAPSGLSRSRMHNE
jgi:hypothetical protein